MTRYAIDATAALHLARDHVRIPQDHQLVSASRLRSEAMSILYRQVRRGELEEREARAQLDGLTTMRLRLLGDRVSRAVAWQIAVELDWDDTDRAEYIAVAKLQADRFVTLDQDLERAARAYVAIAPLDELYA